MRAESVTDLSTVDADVVVLFPRTTYARNAARYALRIFQRQFPDGQQAEMLLAYLQWARAAAGTDGLLVAIGVAVLAWALIGRTRWGFELRIVGDSTDTARYADILLPVCTDLERSDLVASWGHDQHLFYSRQALAPPATPAHWPIYRIDKGLGYNLLDPSTSS